MILESTSLQHLKILKKIIITPCIYTLIPYIMQQFKRLQRELSDLAKYPTLGISCYAQNNKMDTLTAIIIGPHNTPYKGLIFELEVKIPDRYPFEPPGVKFITPVYHPNIDDNGRICLDILKMPPAGEWNPTVTLQSLLTNVQMLLGDPNLNDPLMPEIAREYSNNKTVFEIKANIYSKKPFPK